MNLGAKESELVLVLAKGIGAITAGKLINNQVFKGDVREVVRADVQELKKIEGVSEKGAKRIRHAIDEVFEKGQLETELELIEKHRAKLVCQHDEEFPLLLRGIDGAPRLLWVKGQLEKDDAVSCAMVGARACTSYGREQAGRMAGQLAAGGICIVSGGAKGIDSAAHWGAMGAGGKTIVVLGCGLGKPYPKDNLGMFRKIVEGEMGKVGAVMSEHPVMTVPRPELFPARNRIISGMSLCTLIVEAAVKSGAMRTASHAIEQGKELLAMPGRIDSRVSRGCLQLLKEGAARMATGAGDVMEVVAEQEMLLRGSEEVQLGRDLINRNVREIKDEQSEEKKAVWLGGLSEDGKRIVQVLMDGEKSFDELVGVSGLGAGAVQSEMMVLEIRGVAKRRNGVFQLKN